MLYEHHTLRDLCTRLTTFSLLHSVLGEWALNHTTRPKPLVRVHLARAQHSIRNHLANISRISSVCDLPYPADRTGVLSIGKLPLDLAAWSCASHPSRQDDHSRVRKVLYLVFAPLRDVQVHHGSSDLFTNTYTQSTLYINKIHRWLQCVTSISYHDQHSCTIFGEKPSSRWST